MVEHVGVRVRRLREHKKWSLDELADESGLDRGTIGRIELGKQKPNRATIRSLATALGVDPTLLMNDPRLRESRHESSALGRQGSGHRIEDRLADLLAYIKTLEGNERRDFIRAVIALLTALEHARPAASGGAPQGHDR